MNTKVFNLIFKVIFILLAVLSFISAFRVWFFNYHMPMFTIGSECLLVGLLALLAAMGKDSSKK